MWTLSPSSPGASGLELEDAKHLVREEVRRHRRDRPERERREAADAIAVHARALLDGVTTVAAYAARPSEPNTGPLLEVLDEAGVRILLPVLGPGLTRDWAAYRVGDPLAEHAPGRPPEPEGPGLGESAIASADLIFAPALAVDTRGVRLGQGGGWYDRVLAHAQDQTPVIAIVFEDERCSDPLPSAAHDRPVDGVLTPSGLHWLRS
ncbi:5-formyltetrahydrofolate cyclo-ligase [Ruania suaedae]|uniref:5-formyltetrahydrofolate cyclo-ligase n=1 Tax=Ruania suaedae TaxID=2897774 RepID=UPI001E4C31C5|nr:5-formyltetrahydrofolate cyclo-ligase [Ruania suaedae]UFU03635.1 5-formyltetrahydrofolate cyclo-ligase [Ruania suaedae]